MSGFILNVSTGIVAEDNSIHDAAPSSAESVRYQRDVLLVRSDWTQVADAPVDKVAWATYRQELRDITKQAGFPTDIIWPTKPE